MVWFGAIAELTSVGATTFISLIGTTRIVASRAAQRTAASDAGDPSTPTTMLDRAACLHIASSPLEVPLAIMAPTPVAVIVAANNVTMPTMSKRTLATTRVFRWAAAEFRQGGRSQLLGDTFSWRRRCAGRAPSVPRSPRRHRTNSRPHRYAPRRD